MMSYHYVFNVTMEKTTHGCGIRSLVILVILVFQPKLFSVSFGLLIITDLSN